MRGALFLGLIVLIAGAAAARPPPNADMSLAPWFQSLRQPGTGASCCSIADCRRTETRINGGHYEAMIDGEWRIVPQHAILERADNPTGQAVVCYTPTQGIMCFIRGPEV